MLTMHPGARRWVVRMLAEIEASAAATVIGEVAVQSSEVCGLEVADLPARDPMTEDVAPHARAVPRSGGRLEGQLQVVEPVDQVVAEAHIEHGRRPRTRVTGERSFGRLA